MNHDNLIDSDKSENITKSGKKRSMSQEIRWDKLDNTANLFPVIAGESMSNVYRISVTLTELVDHELLQEALDIVLPKFDGFNLRLQKGIFWYYFEENGNPAPKVKEENTYPCRFIVQNKNKHYLFSVAMAAPRTFSAGIPNPPNISTALSTILIHTVAELIIAVVLACSLVFIITR